MARGEDIQAVLLVVASEGHTLAELLSEGRLISAHREIRVREVVLVQLSVLQEEGGEKALTSIFQDLLIKPLLLKRR